MRDRLRCRVLLETGAERELTGSDVQHDVTLAPRKHVDRHARRQIPVAVRRKEARDEVDAHPRDEFAGTGLLYELEP